MTWNVIVCAARVSDTLKAEPGAMASRFKTEDEWLRGARAHLADIFEDPAEHVESWNLEICGNTLIYNRHDQFSPVWYQAVFR